MKKQIRPISANPLDENSKPLKQETTKLAIIYWLNPRDSKKGRLWMPVYDDRFPLVFPLKYAYISKFLEKNNVAGNHYHKTKQEILIPLEGDFEIFLEDIVTKERESFAVHSEENKAVYVRTDVSHKIISKQATGILLVLASVNSTPEDEIEYVI